MNEPMTTEFKPEFDPKQAVAVLRATCGLGEDERMLLEAMLGRAGWTKEHLCVGLCDLSEAWFTGKDSFRVCLNLIRSGLVAWVKSGDDFRINHERLIPQPMQEVEEEDA